MSLELDSEIIQTADAIVDLVNNGEFSQLYEAKRFYDPSVALETLPELPAVRVAVLPQAAKRERIARGYMRREFDISVAVCAKIKNRADTDELDALMLLAEEVAAYLEDNPLETYTAARQLETEIGVPYSPAHFRDKGLFLAPATITYLVQ